MGLFGHVFETGLNLITSPLDLAHDVMNPDSESKLGKKIDRLTDNAEDIASDIENMDLL